MTALSLQSSSIRPKQKLKIIHDLPVGFIVTFRLLRRRAYAPHINAETVERGACKNKESHERGKGGELKSHSRALILGAYGRFGSGGSLSLRSTNNSAAASAL
jgi:hypothetical protein